MYCHAKFVNMKTELGKNVVGISVHWERKLLNSIRASLRREFPNAEERPQFTRHDLEQAWNQAGGKCAVSGLEFSDVKVGTGKAQKCFAPSPDRIDPEHGHIPGNVRIVCVIANFAMNRWGEKALRELVENMWKFLGNTDHIQTSGPWEKNLNDRIAAAEMSLKRARGVKKRSLSRSIAALKAVRTMGQRGLREKAVKAVAKRRERNKARQSVFSDDSQTT